jgi:hypothetical protein
MNSRSWYLVDEVPISLAKGSHYQTGDLPVNLTASYSIEVYAENRIDPEKLKCLLGIVLSPRLCNTASVLRAHWILASAGKTVGEGESDDTVGFGGGGPGPLGADRTIGTFPGQKGHSYRLDLYILSDTANLNVTNPHLYVGVQDYHLESALFISGFIKTFCLGIISFGGLMLLGSFLVQRRTKRISGGIG